MNSFDKTKAQKALFSSQSAHGYDSESESTFKRTNCSRGTKKGRKRQNEEDSGLRSKFLFEGVLQEVYNLQMENAELRRMVVENVNPPHVAEQILLECESLPVDIFLPTSAMNDDELVEEQSNEDDGENGDKHEASKPGRKSPRSLSSLEGDTTSKTTEESKFEPYYRTLELEFETDKNEFLVEAFSRGYAY